MLKIIENLEKIKKSNLFIFLENKNDLEKLNFLNLEKNILENIKTNFNKNSSEEKNNLENKDKSFFLEYFIGTEKFEKIFINFFDKQNSKKTIEEFMGDNFRKTPNDLIILNTENILETIEICLLSKYKFDYYLEKKNNLKIKILLEKKSSKNIEKEIEKKLEFIKNIFTSRDLVNLATPEKTPKKIIEIIKSFNLKNTKIKIIEHEEIKKIGLNLIDNVGKASENKPALVIFERIIDENLPTYGFVGKGITFDSGGLNIKIGEHMKNMKTDMGGASNVIFTMKELDKKDLKVNIIGAIALAENSISENAYRPDDIIKAYNGKTVEIINTDAEGRLVLADSMSYISKNYNLQTIITTATLTGACMIALGYNYAGIMGNDKDNIKKLIKKSKKSYEKFCELPFDNYLISKTKGEISDLKNLTKETFAGASLAAAFLSNFCDNNEKFIHLDIAGTASRNEDYGICPSGATGFGIKSMSEFFMELN